MKKLEIKSINTLNPGKDEVPRVVTDMFAKFQNDLSKFLMNFGMIWEDAFVKGTGCNSASFKISLLSSSAGMSVDCFLAFLRHEDEDTRIDLAEMSVHALKSVRGKVDQVIEEMEREIRHHNRHE